MNATTPRVTQMVITTRGCRPITPPPLPSHKGIGARQTGHLDRFRLVSQGEELILSTDLAARLAIPIRAAADPTAVNKHSPHMIWPQGVSVALVGEAKQIGHE